MVGFEFGGSVYAITEAQATMLAETLRGYAKGKLPEEQRRLADLSGNVNWSDGALAVADFTEEILVGNFGGPIPLEGKAAEATFWTLRAMDLETRRGRVRVRALRDALSARFGVLQS